MPSIDRRRFLSTGAVAALAGAGSASPFSPRFLAGAESAAGPSTRALPPGFYRFQLGEFAIIILGDGSFELPAEIFGANVTEQERAAYYTSRYLPLDAIRLPSNPALIDTGRQLILVDTGSGGGDPAATTGKLSAALAAVDVAPDTIDLVILTHAHPDHLGGLIGDGGDEPYFRNAAVVLSDVEHALWSAADLERRLPEWVMQSGIIELNRRVFAACADRLTTVPMDGEIVSGIRSIATPGHTPGHIGVLVESAGAPLVMVGDAVVTPHTQFERPNWHLAFDLDEAQGVRTRRRLLDMAATDRLLIHGFHLPFPGVGHAVRDGSAYRWLPNA